MPGRWVSAGGAFVFWRGDGYRGRRCTRSSRFRESRRNRQLEAAGGAISWRAAAAAAFADCHSGTCRPDPRDPNLYLPTFRVSTSVVIVPTLVEKADGEVLYGLKPKDFEVLDNGVPQKVHVDDDLDMQPVSLVVCVERGRDAPLEFDKIAQLGPLLQLFTGDGHGQVALVAFDSNPTWVEPFTREHAMRFAGSAEHAGGRRRGGDSGCGGLLGESAGAAAAGSRRVLLLISESRDHGSRHFNIPELVERIGTSNTLVLSLVFSPSKSEIIDWGRGEPGGGDAS